MTKQVVRETERDVYNDNNTEVMSYEDFLNDVKFQIGEDSETHDLYNEFKLDNPESTETLEDFMASKLKGFLDDMENGYSISILGDTYYYKNS